MNQPQPISDNTEKIMKKILKTTALAFASLATFGFSAHAQNTNFVFGDLMLFFQNPSGTTGFDQQIFVSLGNTATVFRDAAASQTNLLNIINIDASLDTFGTGWANETTIFGGLGGVWGTASVLNSTLENGDPNRTVYTSQARSSTGIVGSSNTIGFSIGADGIMSLMSNSITGLNNLFETQATTQQAVISTSVGATTIAAQNPAGGNGWNNNIPAPGVQQQGSAGSFGTFGPVTNVQFMWDLYRIQARNNIAGQSGLGDPVRQGDFLGTITVDNVGNVSFVTVPEPTTAMFLVGTGFFALMARRRRSNA